MQTSLKPLLSILCVLLFFYHGFPQDFLNPKQEFRGVWIATVMNIDFPDSKNFSPDFQKKKFEEILDFYAQLNFNAVIVQIRPAADAFYPSRYAPWSRYLTEKEGQAPTPYYDPLKFMIQAAQERGMEFHAWLNPYRATVNADTLSLASNHPLKLHPEWFMQYARKYYFNPALSEVQEYLTNVVMEVVQKYDVDAIHFDDYFYPYKVQGEAIPDSACFGEIEKQSFKTIHDWRRHNINTLIQRVSDSIKITKPYVKFGVSPFGVWRNRSQDDRGSDTKAGQTSYDNLYADPLLWLEKGWIDYLMPQLYWSIGFEPASYSKLLEWWAGNCKNKPLMIGHAAYKINNNADKRWLDREEIAYQVVMNRIFQPVKGSTYFSARSLMNNPLDVIKTFRNTLYPYPAIIPPYDSSAIKNTLPPEIITAKNQKGELHIQWQKKENQLLEAAVRYFLIYRMKEGEKITTDNPAVIRAKIPVREGKTNYSWSDTQMEQNTKYIYIVTSVNRQHCESLAENPLKVWKKRKKVKIEK